MHFYESINTHIISFICRHIDNNQISNITEFTSDAYGALYLEYYAIKLQEHNPFYTMRYLEEL